MRYAVDSTAALSAWLPLRAWNTACRLRGAAAARAPLWLFLCLATRDAGDGATYRIAATGCCA